MKWAVVPEQNRLIEVIDHHKLREAAAGAQNVADFHGDRSLQVTFTGAGNAARGQQRVPDDEAGLELLVLAARRTVIIIG